MKKNVDNTKRLEILKQIEEKNKIIDEIVDKLIYDRLTPLIPLKMSGDSFHNHIYNLLQEDLRKISHRSVDIKELLQQL